MKNLKSLWKNKTVRIVGIAILSLALLLAVWKVFFGKSKPASAEYEPTADEIRLSVILSEIEGVENATVMIAERDGVPVSAIVVFSGEDGILVRTRIIEATARALAIEAREVLVYPAK